MNWCYNGREYEYSILEYTKYRVLYDSIEKLLNELETLDRNRDETATTEDSYDEATRAKVAEMMKHNCEIIESFFSSLFGEEAALEICGKHILEHTAALASFFIFVTDEIAIMQEAAKEIKAQYEREIAALEAELREAEIEVE